MTAVPAHLTWFSNRHHGWRIAMVRSNSSRQLQVSNFSIQSRERMCVEMDPDGAASFNEALSACLRLGRATCKKWSGCHRRSLVEAKMNCFKCLGERFIVRTFENMATELHICLALLNWFRQLGSLMTVTRHNSTYGWVIPVPNVLCSTRALTKI